MKGSKKNFKPGTLPVIWSREEYFTFGVRFNSENGNNAVDKNLKIKLEDLKVTLNLLKIHIYPF